MPRLPSRIANVVPPLQRRQARIEDLQRQLLEKDQEISELKDSHTQNLRRSREETDKWRTLTRSKVAQLEEKAAQVQEIEQTLVDHRRRAERSSFKGHLLSYKSLYGAMGRMKDPTNLVMRQVPYKLRNYSFAQSHGVRVPEVFAVWSSPADIDLSSLSAGRIVLKADSGSSGHAVWPLVRDGDFWGKVGSDLRLPNGKLPEDLVEKMRTMRGPFFAEELLTGTGASVLPEDIKLFMSYGEVLQVMVMQQSEKGSIARELFTHAFFDESGRNLGKVLRGARYSEIAPPTQLPELVEVAKRLSLAVGLPFIRVDLYQTDNGPVLGELTLLPGGAQDYTPKHDQNMGKKWTAGRARLERDIGACRTPGMLFGPKDYDWHYPEDASPDGPNSWPRRIS